MAKNENKNKLKWVSTLKKTARSLIPGSDTITKAIKKRKANSKLEDYQKAAKRKNEDFQKMKKNKMSKEAFIKKYPDSATARESRGGKPYVSKKEINKLQQKQIDFKKMKKGDMTKEQFVRKYPNSITARNYKPSKKKKSKQQKRIEKQTEGGKHFFTTM